MRLAQRGDRAFVKIRGGTRLTRTLTRPTQSGPALAVVQYNALPHQRSCRVRGGSLPLPRFGFAASRLSDLSLVPHSRCSQGCAGRCGGGDPRHGLAARGAGPGVGLVAFVGEGDPSAGSSWARCRSAGLRGCEAEVQRSLVQIIGKNVVL